MAPAAGSAWYDIQFRCRSVPVGESNKIPRRELFVIFELASREFIPSLRARRGPRSFVSIHYSASVQHKSKHRCVIKNYALSTWLAGSCSKAQCFRGKLPLEALGGEAVYLVPRRGPSGRVRLEAHQIASRVHAKILNH